MIDRAPSTFNVGYLDPSLSGDSLRTFVEESLSRLNESSDLTLVLPLVEGLLRLGRRSDALDLLEPRVVDPPSNREEALALGILGLVHFEQGRILEAVNYSRKAYEWLSPTVHHVDLARVSRWLGYAIRAQGRVLHSLQYHADALSAARRVQNQLEISLCHQALSLVTKSLGRLDQAAAHCEWALEAAEVAGAGKVAIARNRMNLAVVQLYAGNWVESARNLGAVEEIARAEALPFGHVLAAIARTRLLRRQGDFGAATTLATQTIAEAEDLNLARSTVLALEEVADCALAANEPADAIPHLERALARAREIAPEGDLVYEVAWRLASAYRQLDRLDEANSLAEEAVRLASKAGDKREHANSLVELSYIRVEQRKAAEAVTLAEQAIDIFVNIQTPWELAVAHEAAAHAKGEIDEHASEVRAHWLNAHALYAKLGAAHCVDRMDQTLRPRPIERLIVDQKHELVASSPTMLEIIRLARDVADATNTVLIEGATGTGKGLIARLIHESGPRVTEPFVAINCAAVAHHLLESELFGHRRGAFTGADRDRQGLLAAARGGTVFLDEIDKASPEFQAKLLHVLEERTAIPVGGTEPVEIEARVLCAANRDLHSLAEHDEFLPDLFYRLAGIRLAIPSLVDRPEDRESLTQAFLERAAEAHGRRFSLTKDAAKAFEIYHWPGNVRELKHTIESASFFARSDGKIRLEHLAEKVQRALDAGPKQGLPDRIEQLEREEITKAMQAAKGNKSQAARILGVTRKGLGDRLRRLGLDDA